jgi:single-stranded-DNA-specific exonuclease
VSEDVKGFLDRARRLAEVVRSAGSVAVVSHIDADGIASAAIAKGALELLEVPHRLQFVPSLGEGEMHAISLFPEDMLWICDLGASCCQSMAAQQCIIADHHRLFEGGQARLDQFGGTGHMLNPLLFGMDGSYHLSGAGNTYFVARELDPRNRRLAYLSVVGAVGDMQDRGHGGLIGPLHEMVIDDARATGSLKVEKGELPFFGWVTRSAAAMLAFSNDLKGIGYSDTIKEVAALFHEARVPLKRSGGYQKGEGGTGWRSWSELEPSERRIMMISLRERLERLGLHHQALDHMLGDVYLFPEHPPGSPTREAKEFATLLNASGRYILTPQGEGDEERGDLIVKVCLNPRIYSETALQNVENHKGNIREGVRKVHRVEQKVHIQYLMPKPKSGYCLKVNDTILGIITSMVLDQRGGDALQGLDPDKPLVAMAEKMGSSEMGKDPMVKVSTRMNRELVNRGINLGKAIGQASIRVGGGGGGHDVAAGANIPKKKIRKFLEALDEEIGQQLSRFSPSR